MNQTYAFKECLHNLRKSFRPTKNSIMFIVLSKYFYKDIFMSIKKKNIIKNNFLEIFSFMIFKLFSKMGSFVMRNLRNSSQISTSPTLF